MSDNSDQAHDMSTDTIDATLRKDLKLFKKLARWLPKLTDKEMKKERVRMCDAFVHTCCHSLTILDRVHTVVELAGGEERAGQPNPHPGDLEEAVGGYEKTRLLRLR
jgi:hypothetical protein